jgi:OOP family OmpA-OmpF porin
VRRALIRRGIDRRRVVSQGYGEERPLAENSTPEGRSLNRRVEIVIIGR